MISIINEVLTLQSSVLGYNPYIKRGNQILIKIQHAPLSVQSSLVVPAKLASKISQLRSGGIFWIKTKIINKVNIELNQLELIFLF